ncbi:MAG TPA: globin domain-containing protein [Streptosporangiaceae bacterium]|jgi:NAD(P)H-flavin reductase|nr:globin domain-containing protein [Streptosporangiaceae bacterium]
MDQDPDPLGNLLAAVDPVSGSAMTYFYGHLFAIEPQIRAMFPPAMDIQRIRFYRALSHIVSSGGNAAELTPYLEELGRAHRKFGVQKEHYDAFRQALEATWRRYAPDAWTDAAADAWDDVYGKVAGIMIEAAERDAEHAPPWWLAEITGHELRAADLAVLTLQPSQPMHYLPGQHMSVQTPRWPRLWRNYSIANAPREDGTLTIHVRAVPGGLVSAALVHHVTVGDTLLLGAPSGSMIADMASERDILCLAGGTGLAPVKAIVEATIRIRGTGRRREIVLYHGVRRESAFYDMPDLQRMEMAYPWLQVIPVVSEEAARDTIHGTIPDVVAGATWKDRDIYVSGPDEMTAKTVSELKRRGAPEELIHYDCPPF